MIFKMSCSFINTIINKFCKIINVLHLLNYNNIKCDAINITKVVSNIIILDFNFMDPGGEGKYRNKTDIS